MPEATPRARSIRIRRSRGAGERTALASWETDISAAFGVHSSSTADWRFARWPSACRTRARSAPTTISIVGATIRRANSARRCGSARPRFRSEFSRTVSEPPSGLSSSRRLARVSSPPSTRHVTRLLMDWRGGNQSALDELLPLVYKELRRLAQARLRQEPRGHTLQATALVHEAYVRLVDLDRLTLSDRTHFFAMAARVMRQVLVDHARRKRSDKRGGGATMITLGGVSAASSSKALDVDVMDL